MGADITADNAILKEMVLIISEWQKHCPLNLIREGEIEKNQLVCEFVQKITSFARLFKCTTSKATAKIKIRRLESGADYGDDDYANAKQPRFKSEGALRRSHSLS